MERVKVGQQARRGAFIRAESADGGAATGVMSLCTSLLWGQASFDS